ncbi:MAG: MCP four helix bundle domain-containing protein [Burkholderiales bacterium]|nr:MCP four helix bundle domain-containing protein [Burkholderiales bacterium]
MSGLHLKLGQRLALSYGAVIVLLIAMSFVGLGMLSRLSTTTDDALKDKYPKTILVNQVVNELEVIARAMRNTLFLNEAAQIQEQLDDIKSANNRMAATLTQLKQDITSARGRAIIREMEIVHSAYIVNQEDFIRLLEEKRMSEAKNLLLVDLNPYQVQYFDLLRKLNQYQSELMTNASSEVALTYVSARNVILGLALFAALLSLLITTVITRSLLKQLGGEPDYAAEVAQQIAHGNLSSQILLMKGDQTSLLSVMSSMRDRLLERTEALENTNSELEATVETLKRTQTDLVASEKMAALGSLVAGVAHELNTPLGNSVLAASTITDLTRLITESIAGHQLRRAELDQHLKEIQHGGEILLRNLSRASELVSSFKQVAVDRQTSQFREFLLADIVHETLLTLHPIYKKMEVEIMTDIPPEISMHSYPGPLGQVITNLVHNALVHGFENQRPGKIHIAAHTISPNQLSLVIADDGVGIPPGNLPRIFDPFFTTKLGKGGSGLGLHIVYNIVHTILLGNIQVSSKLDLGARFELTLPIRIIPT